MSMKHNGLAKLCEETGELAQVVGKLLQYPELQNFTEELHPDGTNLRLRLADEMADVMAAIVYVGATLNLDRQLFSERVDFKAALFFKWRDET